LDIKPENILLGEDFTLKLTDYGHSWKDGDEEVKTKGTKYYAPPELESKNCKNPYAVDIFSCGIVLFILLSRGNLPQFTLSSMKNQRELMSLLESDSQAFWAAHMMGNNIMKNLSDDFRQLFESMTKNNPEERISLKGVKNSKWYKGEILQPNELKILMGHYRL
jgi:serine/threonine protein kinase